MTEKYFYFCHKESGTTFFQMRSVVVFLKMICKGGSLAAGVGVLPFVQILDI